MKTKLKYICLSAAAGLTLSLSSCSDFMDLTPEDQYDETTVWSDADLAKTVVNDVYSYVCDIAQEVNPDAWTDDAFFTHVYGCRDINEATVSTWALTTVTTARSNGASNTKESIVPIWFWQISTTFLKRPV